MANLNKPIRERGIVLNKYINEAREAGQSADGNIKWDKRDEEYVVKVYSCDEEDFNNNTGIPGGTLADYKVSKDIFNKIRFGQWVAVKYNIVEFNGQLRIKPDSLTLIQNNQ